MNVLLATPEQAKHLQGKYLNGSILEFILDENNNFVVNESILNDSDFIEIRETLLNLPIIEFKPKQTNE